MSGIVRPEEKRAVFGLVRQCFDGTMTSFGRYTEEVQAITIGGGNNNMSGEQPGLGFGQASAAQRALGYLCAAGPHRLAVPCDVRTKVVLLAQSIDSVLLEEHVRTMELFLLAKAHRRWGERSRETKDVGFVFAQAREYLKQALEESSGGSGDA